MPVLILPSLKPLFGYQKGGFKPLNNPSSKIYLNYKKYLDKVIIR
jgi:hypothetical protein